MHVGFMASHADGGKSGISQYEINLIKQYKELNKNLDLDVFINSNFISDFNSTFDTFKYHLAPTSLANPFSSILWHQTVLPRLVRKRGIQLLHLSSQQRLIYHKTCTTIATIHDVGGFHIPTKYTPSRIFYLKYFIPILARRLDGIITESEFSKNDIIKFLKIHEDKIKVIYIGYNSDHFKQQHSNEATNYSLQRFKLPKKYFLYISRLEHPAKNHVRLVEAFSQLKQRLACPHKLVFIGSDWNGESIIRDKVAKLGVQDEVIFKGHIQNDQLPPLIGAAEAFVFPSLFEGFGIPPVEAMACGTPVICSSSAALPEIVGDAAILVNAYRPEEMAESMHRLIKSPTLRKNFIERGLQRCKHFTWKKTADETIKYYQNYYTTQ